MESGMKGLLDSLPSCSRWKTQQKAALKVTRRNREKKKKKNWEKVGDGLGAHN